MAERTSVLIIDDSALIREFLRETFESDPELVVVGTAADPLFARDKVVSQRPDVITLDIEMPRMDGLTFLDKLMAARPTPVVMFSSFTEAGAKATIDALARGAVDFVTKPKSNLIDQLPLIRAELIAKVKDAGRAKIRRVHRKLPSVGRTRQSLGLPRVPDKIGVDQVLPKINPAARVSAGLQDCLVVMGASTGGTVAIETILKELAASCPPIAIVQHMPPKFTLAFAERLDARCQVRVTEAVSGQRLIPGTATIAPGGLHLLVQKDNQGYFVQVKDGPLVNRHKPSVDVLFRSAVNSAASGSTLAVLLTGMGDDGARGLLELRQAGVRTIAQDKESSVIYGMPKVAAEIDAAEQIIALEQVAARIMDHKRRVG